jgi:23S rRNA (uracil1939-C5)-methyltransferase
MVSGAIPGDIVNVRVKKAKSKYYEGEALKFLKNLLTE